MTHAASRRNFWHMMILAVLFGVGLRLALVIAAGWRIDYDEGMIALLGMRVQRGAWMAFVPAQPTLGAIEAYLLAPLFALFGAHVYSFRALSLLLNAAYILTTALVGRAAFNERVGALAGLVAAGAPAYMLFTGMKTWGATIETIILGNVLLLTVHHALTTADRRWLYAAALVAGVMFWIAWLGFYYFVPVGLIVAAILLKALYSKGESEPLHARVGLFDSLRFVLLLVFWFVLGSLPFWMHNLGHDFESFRALSSGGMTAEMRGAVIDHWWGDLIPRLVTGDPAWGMIGEARRSVVLALYAAGVAALIVGAVVRRRKRGAALRAMLPVFVFTLPIIYLFSGYGANALNPWGLDATGRYVLMLHSILPIGAAVLGGIGLRFGNFRAGVRVGAALISLLIVLNLSGIAQTDARRGFDSPYYDRLPESLDPLIDYLDANGFRHLWTDTGIAHVLMFETQERILAADYYDVRIAGGLLRFPDVLAAVEAADDAVYVVPILPGQEDMPLRRAFDAAGIAYRLDHPTPTLAVFVPERRVHPSEVAAGLGYQY